MNYGNIHDIFMFGYRLPVESAIFIGTLFALICVAAICEANGW